MNPEFQRNVWLELGASRAALMPFVIGLVLAVASLTNGARSVAETSSFIAIVLLVIWGPFKAARTVTDEVRDRTWDAQRMSGLGPLAMTLGKLFGATIYCWYGAAFVLVTLTVARAIGGASEDIPPPVFEAPRLLLGGMLAQAVAMAASLAGARRRRGQARMDSFLFFIAGVAAYAIAANIQSAMHAYGTATESYAGQGPLMVHWWGAETPGEPFALASLAVAAALATVSAWRLMRIELQAAAHPLGYAVLASIGVLWLAGFASEPVARAALAGLGFAALTWATAWIEPKDVVAWRALAGGGGNRAALWPASLTGLALTWTAVLTCAALVAMHGPAAKIGSPLAPVAFALFVTRDVALFAFFHLGERQKRGDFAAVLTIVLLYGLAPTLLGGLTGSSLIRAAFICDPDGAFPSVIVSTVSGAIQAACAIALAAARFHARTAALASPQPLPA